MKYRVTRDVTPDECHWLRETVHEGTIVYPYEGVTYGCVGDGIAVSMTGKKFSTFFELPLDALERDLSSGY